MSRVPRDDAARAPAAPADRSAVRAAFAPAVVDWQRRHGRHALPWQNTRDPYRVWLSEIMLQQTQVATVIGYYDRFLDRFPTVADLAAAPADAVMGLWAGLGYYSRARNLHACAQQVVERFGGAFPRTAEQLQTLPGIGRSTAAAISSFCFGERVAILDANVKRVLTRVLAFDGDLASGANERLLWAEATALVPAADAPADDTMPRYTQGLMDLGATVCLPRRPMCLLCPVRPLCAAAREGRPEDYPVRSRTLRRSAESWWLLLATDAWGRRWLQRRPPSGIWAGLHCPPVFASREALDAALPAGARAGARDLPPFLTVLTHKDLHLHAVEALLADGEQPDGEGGWTTAEESRVLGLPAPVRKLLDAIPPA
jgi:A/G-specific adenine glycosylase